MLQKEFEERIGRSVTEQEYIAANAMYENAGDMDKDEFCREWLEIGSRRLVKCLAETAYQHYKDLQETKLLLKESRETNSLAADAMLEIERVLLNTQEEIFYRCENAVKQLDLKVWWLVGDKEVVRRKIKLGMNLNKQDMSYIMQLLK